MFTGIIEGVGQIGAVTPALKGKRMRLSGKLLEEPAELGASLAVDGCCLTIVNWKKGECEVDVGPETLERTTLGRYTVGTQVNLERPLRLNDRLGGHLVSGHVDGVGTIAQKSARGEAIDVRIAVPAPLLRYMIEKGSVAVDGISLTINVVDAEGLSVSIIPHTQTATTLTRKDRGASVNLEVDLIGKYVEKLLGGQVKPGLTGEAIR